MDLVLQIRSCVPRPDIETIRIYSLIGVCGLFEFFRHFCVLLVELHHVVVVLVTLEVGEPGVAVEFFETEALVLVLAEQTQHAGFVLAAHVNLVELLGQIAVLD